MPTPDRLKAHDSSEIPHGEHLTMTDHILAGFQPPEHQQEYLRQKALDRKRAAEEAARRGDG